MAIIHTNNKNEITSITHKGMVVATGRKEVRVMSDVWEMWSYGIVYDVVTDSAKTIYEMAEVDASPELMAQYKRMCENERRHTKACQLWGEHNRNITAAHTLNITLKELKKLNSTYSGRLYDGCWDLLKTKKFRSKFRESLATQLRNWLSEKENKYQYPFSHRQEE